MSTQAQLRRDVIDEIGGAFVIEQVGNFNFRGDMNINGGFFALLAPTVAWLIAARVVSNIAIGIASFISPMYIAELVPAKNQGSLVAVNMLAITAGVVIAYLEDYTFSGAHQWHTMFGLAAIPSIALVIGIWRQPDSPRCLISKSKLKQAQKILQRARNAPDASAEIAEIQKSMGLYGVIAVGAWVFFYLQTPETKGKTLEQIEAHWRSGKPPRAL